MTDPKKTISKLVLCCCADYQRIPLERVKALHLAGVHAGMEVELCADLCYEAAENPEFLRQSGEEPGTVLGACFPRAVKGLFNQAEAKAPQLVDLRNEPVEEILQKLGLKVSSGEASLPGYDHPWRAWYPVLDLERCNHCGKCLDFCLFGVYDRREGQVAVSVPDNCKDNCPACARVCPKNAIIFPKFEESPINGGLEGIENSFALSEVFDENLYHKLAARRRKGRKNLLKD